MFPSKMQFPNPVNKVAGYLGNVGKEAKQYGQALGKTIGLQQDARTYPPAVTNPPISREQKGVQASAASAADKKAFGQLAGAVLQGRRYDNKGRQVNK